MTQTDLIEVELTANYAKYYRLAFSYVGNEADALDVVQEGAYKAIKNAEGLKQPEYLSTWISKIMINEALTILRGKKKIVPLLDSDDSKELEGTPDEYQDFDLRNAIDGLDLTDQMIIKMRFFQDFPIKDISKILKVNENTVKSRLYRTLDKLKIKLEEK